MRKCLLIILCLAFFGLNAQNKVIPKADSLSAVGNYSEAITVLDGAAHPTAKIHLRLASVYKKTGHYGKALKNYEDALAKNPGSIRSQVGYANLLYQTGHFAKADSLFSKLIAQFPHNPDFHYRLGLVRRQENDSTAIGQFRETLQIKPHHQGALYQAAVYHYARKEFSTVDSLCQKALKTYPHNRKVIKLLAFNSYAEDDFAGAAKAFQNLSETYPNSFDDYKKLGYAYYNLQQYDKAIAAFKTAYAKNKTDAQALYFLGLLNNLTENYKEAEAYLKMAIAIQKKGLGQKYQTLGMALKYQKEYRAAIAAFRQALKINPNLYRSQFGLAVCADHYYADMHMRMTYYKRVVHKFKAVPGAALFVQLSRARIGNLKKAIGLKER